MADANTTVARPPSHAGSDRRGILFLVSLLVLILDRVTKIAVAHALPLGGAHVVIPKVFRITHVLNTGAAFSLFGDSASPERVRWLLVGFSLIAAIIVAVVLLRMGRRITRRLSASRSSSGAPSATPTTASAPARSSTSSKSTSSTTTGPISTSPTPASSRRHPAGAAFAGGRRARVEQ